MRCDEVVRELAAPTDDRDPEAMAKHLSACSACAEWARRAEQLDRLWEATRPVEPPSEAWDAVWAQVAPCLPCPSASHDADPPMVDVGPSRNGSGPKLFAHPAPAPAPVATAARPRGRSVRLVAAVGLVGLAQAAAILVALGLAWRSHPRDEHRGETRVDLVASPPVPAAPTPIRAALPAMFDTEIPEGSVKMLRTDGSTARVVDLTPQEMNTGSDVGMVVLNQFESIATPQVAAR